MDPYAYVGNNPEGRTDPTGHFWPWATMLVGAIAGAVIGVAVTTVTSYATTGKPPSGGELLQAAVSGAVSEAIVGVLGPGASVVAAIGIGALSGAAGGVAGRLAYNAVTRTSLSTGLVQAGVEGAVIGGLTGGVLKAAAPLLGRVGGVLGKGLRTVARRLLQNVTDDQNVLLSANPGIARNFLSPNQYAAGQRLPWVANMNYGTALENMVADQVENSPLRFLYRHMGTDMLGQQVPDFVGRGPFSGMNFDITTDNPTQIASHLNRPYGQGLIIIPYLRPAYFFLFP